MLRFCFIAGYAILLILVIAIIAIKVIAILGSGMLGNFALRMESLILSPANLVLLSAVVGALVAAWTTLLFYLARKAPEWERRWVKTLLIGSVFMSFFFIMLSSLGLCAYFLPGLAGEIAQKIAGFLSSPVFMELSFFCIGLILLFAFNIIRRAWEGDEFVYLEIVDPPEVAASLPPNKRSAIYKQAPTTFDDEIAVKIAMIEGALDMNDTTEAFDILINLPEEIIDTPEVKHLRLRLADMKQKMD